MAVPTWEAEMTDEQVEAIRVSDRFCCLLAGPGTGKTLVLRNRVLYLVHESGVRPQDILLVTFTRAATAELRNRLAEVLGASEMPRVVTLHSFALRQLLVNSAKLQVLPKPLRIADDWEERNIVVEDLKHLLDSDVDDVKAKFARLSADWQTLDADAKDWEERFPDPRFLGAWREHRLIYGYTLRSELVYQLKRALLEIGGFTFDTSLKHVLVDEYQDLNRCDLAVIKAVSEEAGAGVYVAGDDDQSIYGFRYAHPEGIRRFHEDYPGSGRRLLTLCKRCDPTILRFALYVAEQDYNRLTKESVPDVGRSEGEVRLLRFDNGEEEARGIASLCGYLRDGSVAHPHDILILLRQDKNHAYSNMITEALKAKGIPVAARTEEEEHPDERQLLAFLRLAVNPEDHLAWRSLIRLRKNRLGTRAIGSLYNVAREEGSTFSDALKKVEGNPSLLGRQGPSLVAEIKEINDLLPDPGTLGPLSSSELENLLGNLLTKLIPHADSQTVTKAFMASLGDFSEPMDLDSILRWKDSSMEMAEPHLSTGAVNILTMHKAKGLSAEVVIVASAEDELIPGRNLNTPAQNDERRLLYVSLTRARQRLYVTYATKRSKAQRYVGRVPGIQNHTLTNFLRGGPIDPIPGTKFVQLLGKES